MAAAGRICRTIVTGTTDRVRSRSVGEGGAVVELGAELARGSRSTIHACGPGAVAKVPLASTPEGWIEFEARYADAVHAAGAPVPRVLGIETAAGRVVSIYERVDGPSMWAEMRARPEAAGSLARVLAGLQTVLFSLAPPVVVPRQVDRLACKVREAAVRVDRSLLDALDVAPDAGPPVLCHGDLHPGNVIMARAGPVVVDWFDAARGAAVADVARTLLLLAPDSQGPSGAGHLPEATPAALGVVCGAYRAAIDELVSPDPELLDRWVAVMAVARLAEGVEPDRLLAHWDAWRSERRPPAGQGATSAV